MNPSQTTSGDNICPECGTPNRPLSVFCAECGASLTGDIDHDHQEGAGQTTAHFQPVESGSEPMDATWTSDDDGQTTQIFTPQSTVTPPPAASPTWAPPVYPNFSTEGTSGRRGFVLGSVATILIVIVIGFFLWSSITSDGFRDTVTGLF